MRISWLIVGMLLAFHFISKFAHSKTNNSKRSRGAVPITPWRLVLRAEERLVAQPFMLSNLTHRTYAVRLGICALQPAVE